MIYKSEMKRQGVWKVAVDAVALEEDMVDGLTEDEDGGLNGVVPKEWSDNWWKTKVTGGSTNRK